MASTDDRDLAAMRKLDREIYKLFGDLDASSVEMYELERQLELGSDDHPAAADDMKRQAACCGERIDSLIALIRSKRAAFNQLGDEIIARITRFLDEPDATPKRPEFKYGSTHQVDDECRSSSNSIP